MVNNTITASFLYGGKTVLNNLWEGRDVICPNSKLFYILSGEIVLIIEDKKIHCKSGDFILIPAETKHTFYIENNKTAKKYWFHFDLKDGNSNFFDSYNLPYKISIGDNKKIKALFQNVIDSDNTQTSELLASSSIMMLIYEYFKFGNVKANINSDDNLDKVINYIRNNYSEKIELNDLAKMVNFTPNYFIRKFKEKTGYSPIKYITVLKLEEAKYLLQTTNDMINEIMEKIGFYDQAHFSKIFKLNSGYSPKKFREIYGNKPFANKENYIKVKKYNY